MVHWDRLYREIVAMESVEVAVGNLAVAIGILIGTGRVPKAQTERFVWSVCSLATAAGARRRALDAFDTDETRGVVDRFFAENLPHGRRTP